MTKKLTRRRRPAMRSAIVPRLMMMLVGQYRNAGFMR
jgi:hypothetical protein